MLGAIIGDIIGSRWEFNRIKTTEFPLFSEQNGYTDDTIMTVAIADAVMNGRNPAESMREWSRIVRPCRGVGGYGKRFFQWLAASEVQPPYNSYGNGAAMRISPVAYAHDDLAAVLSMAEEFTAVTHNHPEGIKGAQATAAAVFMARKSHRKEDIKAFIEIQFGYNLSRSCNEIRKDFGFDESCQGTVPEAIIAFLESTDFESAVRLAVSLGGDADTLACISGSIAEAYYRDIPDWIVKEGLDRLEEPLTHL